MGFRIEFGCADLARTTIAREPDPLWEVLLGMHMVQTDDEPEVFGAWAAADAGAVEFARAGTVGAGAAGRVLA